jgi:hypothetical protein
MENTEIKRIERRLANKVRRYYAGVSKATLAKKQAMIVTDPALTLILL